MKKNLLFILAFLFSMNVFSQTKNDPKAQAILNNVSKKYKGYKTMKAGFKIKVENAQNKVTEQQAGTVYLKGNKYKIEMPTQQIVCNNVTSWTFLKESNEVQVNNYEPDENTISPSQMFTLYEKDFYYRLAEEKVENGKPVQVIELTPINKNKGFFKAYLKVDKTTSTINSLKIMNKDGSKFTYELSQLVPNVALEDAFFNFDPKKHPKIEVIDLR